MVLTSDDPQVLKNYSKRMTEAYTKVRLYLVMPGLEFGEMKQVFSHFDPNELAFRFDVVGGNPRLVRCTRVEPVDDDSYYYKHVKEVVNLMFSKESKCRKLWATNIVCCVLTKAMKSTSYKSLDGSIFRDYIVKDVNNGIVKFGEVFASRFMELVASRVLNVNTQQLTRDAMLKLFGSSGMGVYFEYEAQMALNAATPDDVYHCLCQKTKQIVTLNLGGGNMKLIRNMEDLSMLQDGDCGLPTSIPNYAGIDRILYHQGAYYGFQMTTRYNHDGRMTKLRQMMNTLGIAYEQDFSIVFVVPVEQLKGFVLPTDLGKISLYLTTFYPSNRKER